MVRQTETPGRLTALENVSPMVTASGHFEVNGIAARYSWKLARKFSSAGGQPHPVSLAKSNQGDK